MPGPKCVVQNCQKVKRSSGDSRLAYHKLPRDLDLRKIWFKKIGIEDPSTDYGFVCSKHFKSEDYIRDLQAELLGYIGRRKLKPNAVPSQNLPFEEEDISPEEKKRVEKQQREKLIQDCLKNNGQQKTILNFELFKKLRYSNSRCRGSGRRPGNSTRNHSVVFDLKSHKEKNRQSGGLAFSFGEEDVILKNFEDSSDSLDDYNFDIDFAEDMLIDMEDSVDRSNNDPEYLSLRIHNLEGQVNKQKQIICALRRQIIREKKMMEKIIIATNTGRSLPNVNKRKAAHYDEKAKAALLSICALAPDMYTKFSKALNLPSKQVLSTWNSEMVKEYQAGNDQKSVEELLEDDFKEQDFVEEEFIIESEEYMAS